MKLIEHGQCFHFEANFLFGGNLNKMKEIKKNLMMIVTDNFFENQAPIYCLFILIVFTHLDVGVVDPQRRGRPL